MEKTGALTSRRPSTALVTPSNLWGAIPVSYTHLDKVYLQAGPSAIELPTAKAQKLIEGGYDGKTVVLGIRPEDVHDEQMFIEASPNTVIEATILSLIHI